MMRVKTSDMKNNLSRYLRRVRDTGESITICDRDKPVAVLSPVAEVQPDEDTEWQEERVKILKKAKKLGIRINIPLKRPRRMKDLGIYPTTAPDGRTDIKTIELVRGGRDY